MYAEQLAKITAFRDHVSGAEPNRLQDLFNRLIVDLRTYSAGWVLLEFNVAEEPTRDTFSITNVQTYHLRDGEWPDPDRPSREVAVTAPCRGPVEYDTLRDRLTGQIENKRQVIEARDERVKRFKEEGHTDLLPEGAA